MKSRCKGKVAARITLLVITLIVVLLLINSCSRDDSPSSFLEVAEQKLISADSYRISGEALFLIYYEGKPGIMSAVKMPFEMAVANNKGLIAVSGYVNLEGMFEEVRKTNPSYFKPADPKVPFFLVDNYIYEFRFVRNSEERNWYKKKYYTALSFAGYEYIPALHGLIHIVGNEDMAEIEEGNESSIKYHLEIGEKITEIVLEDLEGFISDEAITAMADVIDGREFDSYCEIDRKTGLITSVEFSIKPFDIERRTSSEPMQGDLYIKADIYDYNEDIKIELPKEAKDAEEMEDPLSSDTLLGVSAERINHQPAGHSS